MCKIRIFFLEIVRRFGKIAKKTDTSPEMRRVKNRDPIFVHVEIAAYVLEMSVSENATSHRSGETGLLEPYHSIRFLLNTMPSFPAVPFFFVVPYQSLIVERVDLRFQRLQIFGELKQRG